MFVTLSAEKRSVSRQESLVFKLTEILAGKVLLKIEVLTETQLRPFLMIWSQELQDGHMRLAGH